MIRPRRLLAVALAAVAIASVLPASASSTYEAEIRRTEYGIPHILAHDYGSLGFGVGYAFAEDNICVMADTFLTVDAERSLYLGPTGTYRSEANGVVPTNLNSDFFYEKINRSGIVEALVDGTLRPGYPGLSQGVKDMTSGWVAGYNAYLRDVGGTNGVTDPACKGEPWVKPITDTQLYRRYYQLIMFASKGALLNYIVAATPPAPDIVASSHARTIDPDDIDVSLIPSSENLGIGSNAWAIGDEASANGRGILLGNPHFPWRGPERFYEFHLTMPGVMNVQGGALFGSPLVHIGTNDHMAWSHTVSVPYRFQTYELKLVPGDPTSYVYDGEIRQMTPTTVDVQVREPGGSITTREHTFWDSHYGPVMDFTGAAMPWTPAVAYTFWDGNEDNFRALEHFFEVNQATTVEEVHDILVRHVGIPWVNTIAADDQGGAYYADESVVPNISDEQLTECATVVGQALIALARLPVLDGTRSSCAPLNDPLAPAPGIISGQRLPYLFRDDYVANSNNSHWLPNARPGGRLEGYPWVTGAEKAAISLRARLGLKMIEERLDGTDGQGPGGSFTQEQVRDMVFNNRQYGGEITRDDLVAMCRQQPVMPTREGPVTLGNACDALAGWDLKANVDSRGASLFRQFMNTAFGAAGGMFVEPFDEADPVNTPRRLNTAHPLVREALGIAVKRHTDKGIALDAPLGQIQRAVRGGSSIPIHGGSEHGMFNYILSPWNNTTGGYPDTTYGSSFVIAATWDGPGQPRADAILTYSLSTDRTSPHFDDQTRLYSDKQWVRLRMSEAEIAASPVLRTYTVSA